MNCPTRVHQCWRLNLSGRARQGLLAALAVDPGGGSWLLTGSSRGRLDLWDMRFQLRVATWQHPARAPVDALAPALAPPGRLGLRPGAVAGPLVYAAAGAGEVGLWDAATQRCHQARARRRPAAWAARVSGVLTSCRPLLC